MAYDRKDFTSGADTFGFAGATISLAGGDYVVPDTIKAIMVVSPGNVVLRPSLGSTDITISGAPVGLILPWHCSHIRQTGTTAVLATVMGH